MEWRPQEGIISEDSGVEERSYIYPPVRNTALSSSLGFPFFI
jgi:hypothetical protein